MNKKKSKLKTILLWILGIVVFLVLAILVFLISVSPGKLSPLVDTNGKTIKNSISEKVKLNIGGVEQGMFITGESKNNPVLLYLHGGPGAPEYPLLGDGLEELSKHYTVCYWDQRASGMSLNRKIDPSKLTPDLLADDAIEVTNYLRERFKQEKIFILGHSWGSFLGIKVVEKRPDLFKAYIGVGQASNQKKSDKIAYEYMLNHAKETNDTKAVEEFEKVDVNDPNFPTTSYLTSTRMEYLNKYGIGISRENGKEKLEESYTNLLFFKGYTLSEKINHIRGMMVSLDNLFPYVLKEDLTESSNNIDIPVFIIQGEFDYVTSEPLANKYFNTITAPQKEYYLFENSAHAPMADEKAKFNKVMKEIKNKIDN